MILNDMEGKAKKGEILIDEEEIDPETVRAMIHYIYTGELGRLSLLKENLGH